MFRESGIVDLQTADPTQQAKDLIQKFDASDKSAQQVFAAMLDTNDGEPSGYCREIPVWEIEQSGLDSLQSHATGVLGDFLTYADHRQHRLCSAKLSDFGIIAPFAQEVKLTSAEKKLCAQLCSGHQLKECAALSNQTYETVRSHLKSVFFKSELSSQSDLVGKFSYEIAEFFRTYLEADEMLFKEWRSYRKYLPRSVRMGVLVGPNDESTRYLDFGDPQSEPLYLIHPLIFPAFDEKDVLFAKKIDRRFIVPVRRGALGDNRPRIQRWSDYISNSANGLRECINNFSGTNEQVDLIALVSGGAVATEYALQHQEKVKSLSFAGTCYSAGKPTSDLHFFGTELVRIMGRNQRAGHAALRYICGIGKKEAKRFKDGMRTIFAGSAADMKLINEDVSDPIRCERLKLATLGSFYSVMFDYLSQFYFDWNEASKIECKTAFVHGAED